MHCGVEAVKQHLQTFQKKPVKEHLRKSRSSMARAFAGIAAFALCNHLQLIVTRGWRCGCDWPLSNCKSVPAVTSLIGRPANELASLVIRAARVPKQTLIKLACFPNFAPHPRLQPQ
jgi:hypothetical protein